MANQDSVAAVWTSMPDNIEHNEDEAYFKHLGHLQVLITVGFLGGPISILFGGVPLSLAALICAVIAFFSLRKLKVSGEDAEPMARRLYIQSIAACCLSLIAFTLNLIFFIDLAIEIMNAANSGTLDSFLNSYLTGGQESSGASVWNK